MDKQIKKILFISLSLIIAQPLFATEVNVYSARKEALIKPLLAQFTKETDIEVNLLTGKADPLLKRLEVEGQNSPADILLTIDVARLIRGKERGLFQAIHSPILEQAIPAPYRDTDNQWFGLSLRSRIIIYAPDRVNENELDRYIDLADQKWKNRICVRSSSNVYNQSLVASMIANHQIEKTEHWAKALVNNFARPPKGGDRDQIKAVAAGICDIALANNYYLAGMLTSSQQDELAAAQKVNLFWPNQNDSGAHMNISGAALLKSAKNQQAAIKLLEFMVRDDSQQWYADANHEYSINPSIKDNSILNTWGNFKADNLDISLLGKYHAEAVLLMDRVGWK